MDAPNAPKNISASAKDPSEYSVEEVINFFWPSDGSPSWARGHPPPDPALLGPLLRENCIDGDTLLLVVTCDLLRFDFGVTSCAQRAYMMRGIATLRARSAAASQPAAPEQRDRAPATGSSLSTAVNREPRRITNIMTTQLAPRLEGRAEPAIEFSSASGESTTVSLSAPAEPAANSSSASESTALPTDGDGGVINPKSLGSDQGIDKNNEPPCDPEDRVLPLYGDSEYDTEDQREIDALPEKKTPDPPPVPINLTKFNDILDQLILNKREEWVGGFTNDPFRSSPMWIERDDAAVRDRAQKNIVHLRIRLSKLRDAMYANRYTSEALVFKACECLDETLKDLFFCEWQSAMLDSMKRSREQNQQVESTPHGVNTSATSGSPYSSFNENDGNGRNSNASDEEGDTCDSTGDEQHESATKKPRLETHGPDNTVPQATQDVIDLTGDSPEPTQAFNPDTPLPSLANRAMWMQNQRTHKPGPSRKAYYAAQKRRQKARAECIKAEEDDKDAQRRFRIAGSSAFASLPLQEASMSSNHRSESPCHSVTDPSLPPRAVPSEKVQISAVKGHSSSITSKEEEAMYQ